MTAAEPRIAPLPPAEWSDDAFEALGAAFGAAAADAVRTAGPDSRPVPNVLTTLLRHPTLTGPFLVYNAVLLSAPTIDPRQRELMVLRVAWRTRSTYEWLQHVRLARSVGITDDEIAAVGVGASDGSWGPLDADLLAATDQLLDDHRIDDGTWTRLAEHLDDRQLIEVTFVVGTYTCLAMVFNSLGLALDADLQAIDAPALPGPA